MSVRLLPRCMTPEQQRRMRSVTLDAYAIERWWHRPADDNNPQADEAVRGLDGPLSGALSEVTR